MALKGMYERTNPQAKVNRRGKDTLRLLPYQKENKKERKK